MLRIKKTVGLADCAYILPIDFEFFMALFNQHYRQRAPVVARMPTAGKIWRFFTSAYSYLMLDLAIIAFLLFFFASRCPLTP